MKNLKLNSIEKFYVYIESEKAFAAKWQSKSSPELTKDINLAKSYVSRSAAMQELRSFHVDSKPRIVKVKTSHSVIDVEYPEVLTFFKNSNVVKTLNITGFSEDKIAICKVNVAKHIDFDNCEIISNI